MDTTVADPLVGQVLDGRYRIESRIARGGMATVYVARDIKLGRAIALKVMHANLAQDDEFVRRFIVEAKSAAALSHPNVVAVYDQGTDGHYVFLAMEYVPGRTLRDLLTEQSRLGPRQALSLMQPVLAALGAAHRAGLVHRDVKPENVLLTDDGQVKVADFGLARAETASKQTKTGMIIGTVGYMAPEQVLSGHADSRSDVYAAGIMLFELLTGYQPHQADSPLAVAYKHVNEVVPLPSSVLPGIPPQLDALVATSTSHDPARRPADANHFLAAVAETDRALPRDIDHQMANVTASFQQPTMQGGGSHTSVLPPGLVRPGAPAEPAAPLADRVISFVTGRFVLIALGLIAALVLGWAVWYQTAGQYETVPADIIGVSVKDAKAQLEAKGYRVAQGKARYDQKVLKGMVAATDPVPGTRLTKSALVTLIPSKGKPPVPVPSVAGKSLSEAQSALSAKGFNADTVKRESSKTVPRDQVVRTDPRAGEMVQPGESVTVVVSDGITVPDLAGKSREEAAQLLQQAGLNASFQEQDGEPPNVVVTQSPPAGTGVSNGDTVTVTVNKPKCFFDQFGIKVGCDNGGGQGQEQIPVPNVVGQNVHDARKTLREAGFQVNVGGFGGDIIKLQIPNGGQAARGSTIRIFRGP
ncbi:Stk1 family PASTA domain-containing Ser/Thr kinase [Actinomadura scrupuli]|uniref:Stk1 family PASTA domain-containing Ser/Thr kinase n=1 Tax=Actinomadura scrupuli TaxID=559629 RepID=UPI003D98EDD1